MLTLQVNSQIYTGWKTIDVSKSIDNLSGQFSFTTSISDLNSFPVATQDSIEAKVDGISIITGTVEKVIINTTKDSHSINISGRDKSSSLIDSTIIKNFSDLNKPIKLDRAIEFILEGTGIKLINNIGNVGVIDNNANPNDPFQKDLSPEITEKAWEFINKLCKQKAIICFTDSDGNLVLDKIGQNVISDELIFLKDSDKNNILSSNYTEDITQRYYKYIAFSQQKPVSGLPQSVAGTGKEATAIDSEIKDQNRIIKFIPETSLEGEQLQTRANWAAKIRKDQSIKYSCVVQGFKHSQDIWRHNTVVKIDDWTCNLSDYMLCHAITYRASVNEGSKTEMQFVNKDAYKLYK